MTYGCRAFSSETEAFEKNIHCFGPGRSNTALGSSPSRDRLRISSPPEDLQGEDRYFWAISLPQEMQPKQKDDNTSFYNFNPTI